MSRMCLILPVLPVATLVSSGAASAQSTFTNQVWEQLQEKYEDARDDGYELRNYILGSLEDSEDDFWTMTFYGGRDYMIWGACDEDCGDLDLAILDEDGTEIDADTLTDNFPLVTIAPAKDAEYEVKVTMYACSTEPCYFGIGIFQK